MRTARSNQTVQMCSLTGVLAVSTLFIGLLSYGSYDWLVVSILIF